jgi:hypothetical protein
MGAESPPRPYLRPKVYRGRQGAKLTLLLLEPPEEGRVLLRFEGFEGAEWNGRVVLHQKKGSGDREQYLVPGTDEQTAVLKWGTMEARPRGCDRDYFMHYDARDSEAVDPRMLIEEYQSMVGG